MDIQGILEQALSKCEKQFKNVDNIAMINTKKVLDAMQEEGIATRHFAQTTGYGYDDVGRDALERLYASVFKTEAAIVRPHIVSGTHAISLCLFGLLKPGDELLYVTGKPYDTLHDAIGKDENSVGSLKEMGVIYREVELTEEGQFDLDKIKESINNRTKVVAVQRSRGYALRRSIMPSDLKILSDYIHANYPNALIMVDNCYGEFVLTEEPTLYGADILVGSLIKNPGGGLAPTGGYIVGSNDAIERISYRLTAPGIGREVGSYAGSYQPFFQGFFMAPHVVGEAMKTAILSAALFELLGMTTTPSSEETRSDIIQALVLGNSQKLIAFCEGIQMASPIDSMALPEPWDMPGYQHQVIMAAGTFVSGASIELSADAPMREPYAVYLQGGLSLSHGKIALVKVLEHMIAKGCI